MVRIQQPVLNISSTVPALRHKGVIRVTFGLCPSIGYLVESGVPTGWVG